MNRKTITGLTLILICLLTACGSDVPAEGTYAWIDAPVHDISVPVGQVITIDGHASSIGGVSRIEIWIDAEFFVSQDYPESMGNLVKFEHIWVPTEPGEYDIQRFAGSSPKRTCRRLICRSPCLSNQTPRVRAWVSATAPW